MTKETIQKAISVLYTTDTKTKAIYLPCNLGEKSLQEWIASYSESYNLDRKIAVGFGDAGATVMENKASFDAEVFVDAELGEFETCEGEKYYFACTDDSENYRDMGGLYCSCKRSGATFEYRVINAGSDSTEDTFRCLNKIKSYIFN